jgi:putative DNA primase/helicase
MNDQAYTLRVQDVQARAHGRWDEILRSFGADERILRRKNMACPLCGGTDRFQYTDRFGEGNYHCRNPECGPGGGFKLAQALFGWDFATVLKKVNACVGGLPAKAADSDAAAASERMALLVRRIWDEAVPIRRGDPVDQYLAGRGLGHDVYPASLRLHPRLGYYERDGDGRSHRVADYPTMLARVDDAQGRLVALHRTYLSFGHKAELADAKKLLSSGVTGASIRLFEPAEELAIAEGIETALAVQMLRNVPTWAAISAGNLERIQIPESVRHVLVYGDNDADADFDGEASAFALARRLRKEARHGCPRTVEVMVPRKRGSDWADVWWAVVSKMKRAA